LILLLGLTVPLRVEGSHVAEIDTDLGAYTVPKLTGKLFAAIGGDIVWYT